MDFSPGGHEREVDVAAAREDDEVALLAAAADGHPKAVATLLDDIAPIVYGFIFARVGGASVADDLLQETLLEALRGKHTFRGESALSTWLCAIARRRIARHWEAERRDELARSGLSLVPDLPSDDHGAVDNREAVLAALGHLPVVHRQVLVLKYLDGCSVAEIAAAVGKSNVQVQSLLQRARDGLRRELADG
jgi:RNA polymerase sigma-70 factor (ECF subfamily)